MKRLQKLATTLTMVLSMGVTTQANAEMELRYDSKGDALLFPVFNGNFENYFTILNDSDNWVQGHLRFRGAAWSGELLDFDVILSPHDVMIFRLADVDNDGFWEIDQSLDLKNFAYTGMLSTCQSATSGATVANCMDQSDLLIPAVGGNITQELVNYHRQWGYVEFIAEGVLNGMTHDTMEQLINPANAGTLAQMGQRRVGNRLGTHLWSWTDADKARGGDNKGASDVHNAISGTAFVTLPGASHGVSYNAETLRDFRTKNNPHRIDNYPLDQAVILHDENASGFSQGTSPVGDYVYGYPFTPGASASADDRQEEARLRFGTTWGPTFIDGDDYNPISTEEGVNLLVGADGQDAWDAILTHANPAKGTDHINSITEVEEAIRLAGQRYTGFFFDDSLFDAACQGNGTPGLPANACSDTTLMSMYYAFFPTKHFYGDYLPLPATFSQHLSQAVTKLVQLQKPTQIELWDTEERPACKPQTVVEQGCTTSPCPPPTDASVPQEGCPFYLPYEGTLFSIKNIKAIPNIQPQLAVANYSRGKFALWPDEKANADNPGNLAIGAHPSQLPTWPFLLYTFDFEVQNPSPDGAFVHHWKRLHR